jgi:hypothetical protein
MIKKIAISLGIILLLILSYLVMVPKFTEVSGVTNLDSLTLSDTLTALTGVIGTLTQGGGVRATSTTGAVLPLLASDFDVENMIDVTLNVQDGTVSFPATSTLTSFIPNTGDNRTIFIRNATTTTTMDLTIAGGTGVLLKKATSSAVITGDADGANFFEVHLVRKANTDIEALMLSFVD